MKRTVFVALALLAATLTAGTAAAQPAPYNQVGITMGHWHLASKDVEANKKLFVAMGGKLFMPGGQPLIMFPGLYISLILGNEKGEGGTVGSVVNHVGFIVDNVQKRVAEWKAKGVTVLPGGAPNPLGTSPVTALPGFPSKAELVDRYVERSARDVEPLAWFEALALWKAAVFCEAIYGRYVRGELAKEDTRAARFEAGVPYLAETPAEVLER